MKNTSHFLEEHFHAVAACPLCRKKYDPLEARIITAEDGVELVHVECQRCHGAIVATITGEAGGATSMMGIVTDLSSRDLFRLRAREPIIADDVLLFHTLLSKDRGQSFLHTIEEEIHID
ncbi:MAG: hypothetical protein Q7S16_02760 [bacterium]|nr:hypothetical protein [bacterium]